MTTRRYKVETGHPRQCRVDTMVDGMTCNWVRVSVDPKLCSKHLGQWNRGTLGQVPNAYRHKNDPLWIPDDGVVDELAVEIAAKGLRVVRMTTEERIMAAKRILAAGGTSGTISQRLGVSHQQGTHLMHQVNGNVYRGNTQARGVVAN